MDANYSSSYPSSVNKLIPIGLYTIGQSYITLPNNKTADVACLLSLNMSNPFRASPTLC